VSAPRLNGSRVLVTGARGFIGTHLLERLRAHGAEIHAASRRAATSEDAVTWHEFDLSDIDAVRRVVTNTAPEVVFHLAGDSRAARGLDLVDPTFRSNLVGTVNLLSVIAELGSARVVLAGSLEEPDAGEPPSSPYAASKLAARSYAELFRNVIGLPVVVLRVFMVYGPKQQDLRKLVPSVILSLLRGQPPQLTSGRREIDWVYVGDVADAFVAAALAEDQDAAAASVDVGSGTTCTIRSVVEQLVRLIDPRIVPSFGAIEDRTLEQVRVADVETAAREIGWRPQVDLREGLERTVSWYRTRIEPGALGLDSIAQL
jgi:nucleoside-diphosphate-sugar epimerase